MTILKNSTKYLIILILTVFCLFTTAANSTLNAKAETLEGQTIETTDPLEDLDGSVIGGKEFSLENYQWNANGVPQMIYFAEVGYSRFSNLRDDYALYIYVYNPAGLIFDDSEYNKIELAFGANNKSYSKYSLEIMTYSKSGGYEGLFYKFKITLSETEKSTALSLLSSNARVYTIVSMELAVGGEITDYTVGYDTDTNSGTIYTYTGYTLGYGSDLAEEDSLACTVEGFSEYLTLDVEQTVYRPEGDYYNGEQSQLNSCWFTIPNEYIERFGDVSKIKYEWYEYLTKPILVTEDANLYSYLYALHGNIVSALNGYYFLIAGVGNHETDIFGGSTKNLGWTSNIDIASDYSWRYTHTSYYASFPESSRFDRFSAVFYTGGNSFEDYIVSSEELTAQMILNSQYLNDTSIAGKYASAMFEDYVQDNRTMGYNLAESQSELEIYINNTTKSQMQVWFGGYTVETEYESVEAFRTVSASDLIGGAATIAERLYISEADVPALMSRYATAVANDETLVLFRYASTDYYSIPIVSETSDTKKCPVHFVYDEDMDEMFVHSCGQNAINANYDGYMASETVFLNFDIISLTFTTEKGVSTEVPVVMSPQDVISDITPPLEENYSNGDFDWLTVAILLACSVGGIIITMIIKRYAH